jgi:hypothetical protein
MLNRASGFPAKPATEIHHSMHSTVYGHLTGLRQPVCIEDPGTIMLGASLQHPSSGAADAQITTRGATPTAQDAV